MDSVIIGSLIGAGGVIIAAFIGLWGLRQQKRADKEEALRRKAIKVLEKKQPEILDLYYEYDKWFIDIKKDGSCLMKRLAKIVPTDKSIPITDKKFIISHEGIGFYLSKTGKELSQIDPDKEFGIVVRDINNNVRLGSSTSFGGIKNEELVTNVIFDNPLRKDAPDLDKIEIEITYSKLDVSFFWKKLWEEHMDVWVIEVDNPVRNHETQILFPETLPSWFRLTEIGTVLIPKEWAFLTKGTLHKRKRLLLTASNLERGNTYKLKIDVS
jgi:hypothetical protein